MRSYDETNCLEPRLANRHGYADTCVLGRKIIIQRRRSGNWCLGVSMVLCDDGIPYCREIASEARLKLVAVNLSVSKKLKRDSSRCDLLDFQWCDLINVVQPIARLFFLDEPVNTPSQHIVRQESSAGKKQVQEYKK